MPERQAAWLTGPLAGIAGLLVFLTLHQLWIRPIWFILPLGLVVAVGGGLAVGWSYAELLPGLPPRLWRLPALVALIALTLLPAVVLAELHPPVFTVVAGEVVLAVSVARLVFSFGVELLLAATVIGGVAGWLIGRTRRAAGATALAGFVFALGPGHNLPFLGHTPATGLGLGLVAAIILSAATVLVVGQAILARRW
ncbi:MAG: hypothetical protein IT317_10200 [Anaerolineales bacterium]|nr:hypothetical protein [Anaerolineales bacterium]